MQELIQKNQEKAKKKMEKRGIRQNQILKNASVNAKQIEEAKQKAAAAYEKKEKLDKERAISTNSSVND